jgi:hypothetical protein
MVDVSHEKILIIYFKHIEIINYFLFIGIQVALVHIRNNVEVVNHEESFIVSGWRDFSFVNFSFCR